MKPKMTKTEKRMVLSWVFGAVGFVLMFGLIFFGLLPEESSISTSEAWALGAFWVGLASFLTGCALFLKNVESWFTEGVIVDPRGSTQKK